MIVVGVTCITAYSTDAGLYDAWFLKLLFWIGATAFDFDLTTDIVHENKFASMYMQPKKKFINV